jgi:prepilin-type N-terminal cleavage/methylation domain-containing protein
MNRRAFTLVEILVVLAIIGILSALLFPAVTGVMGQVRNLQCDHNLSQIAQAIVIYAQQDADQRHPARATDMIATDGFSPKVFLCPEDIERGKSPSMGRDNMRWDQYTIELPGTPKYGRLHEEDMSYMYETGSEREGQPRAPYYSLEQFRMDSSVPNYDDSDLFTFFKDRLVAGSTPSLRDLVDEELRCWQQGKINQQRFGNLVPGTTLAEGRFGEPFAADAVPLVRCYWHVKWITVPDLNKPRAKRVRNITMGMNVTVSIPYWEIDENSDFKN